MTWNNLPLVHYFRELKLISQSKNIPLVLVSQIQQKPINKKVADNLETDNELVSVSVLESHDNNYDQKSDNNLIIQHTARATVNNKSSLNNGFKSESCLLEQLRVSDNWRHLMAVEQGGQVKLNLREQISAKL